MDTPVGVDGVGQVDILVTLVGQDGLELMVILDGQDGVDGLD